MQQESYELPTQINVWEGEKNEKQHNLGIKTSCEVNSVKRFHFSSVGDFFILSHFVMVSLLCTGLPLSSLVPSWSVETFPGSRRANHLINLTIKTASLSCVDDLLHKKIFSMESKKKSQRFISRFDCLAGLFLSPQKTWSSSRSTRNWYKFHWIKIENRRRKSKRRRKILEIEIICSSWIRVWENIQLKLSKLFLFRWIFSPSRYGIFTRLRFIIIAWWLWCLMKLELQS